MVRAKKNVKTPVKRGRPPKSKPTVAANNTRNSGKDLSKLESSIFKSIIVNAAVSENTSNNVNAKEITVNDSDKPSSTDSLNKTVTSANSTSPSTSKNSDVVIYKQGGANIVMNSANVSTNNITAVLQKTGIVPQILPATAALAPKYVFIKVDGPPRIFDNIKTLPSGPLVSSYDVPVTLKRAESSAVKIAPTSSVTSQSTASEKGRKSLKIKLTRVKKKDKSKKQKEKSKKKQSKDQSKKKESKDQSKRVSQRLRIKKIAVQKNIKSKKAESSNQQKETNKINCPKVLPKDQDKSIQPKVLQQKQSSSNNEQNLPPSEQNGSAEPNKDGSANAKQSRLDEIRGKKWSEILNAKYLPIKPKPPGYQGPRPQLVQKKQVQKRPKYRGENNTISCVVCNKKLFNNCTLLRHQRKYHRVFISSGGEFECRYCGVQLTSHKHRYKHEVRFHPDNQTKKTPYKCPICLSGFLGMKSIKEHLSKEHSDINLQPQSLVLTTKEEFDKWKASIEEDTMSQYVIRNRHRYKSNGQNMLKLEYACHRRSADKCYYKGKGIRRVKYKGSVKSGLFCPAFIMADISPSDVKISYSFVHLGHECDAEYISMRKRIKSFQVCTLLRCRVCKKVFSQSTNRKHHEKEVHGLDVKYDLELKCPKCFTVFPTRKKMMLHLSKSHAYISLQTSQLTFGSLKEFYEWKSAMEQETKSEYVLDQVYQKTVLSFRRFNCHLSGNGEKKLFCPANVLLKINPKEKTSVDVTYVSTHIGHSGENYETRDKPDAGSVTNNTCDPAKDSHDAALKVYQNVHIIKKDEYTWVVLPFGNEDRVYEVKRLYVEPNHVCKFKCSICNVCSHQFKCNCSVSCLNFVCIHVHIVCLKENHVPHEEEAPVSDNSCLDVDMNYYSEHEENGDQQHLHQQPLPPPHHHPQQQLLHHEQQQPLHQQQQNNVLQEIGESEILFNMKEQAISAISVLASEIRNCNDETKLKGLISSLSNLKNKINSKPKLSPQKRKEPVQKKRRVAESQDNVLAKVIQVAMQLENPYPNPYPNLYPNAYPPM